MKKRASFFVLSIVLIMICVFALSACSAESLLSGDDRTAYNMLKKASYKFKNPSSVSLVSGNIREIKGNEILFCRISGQNGFGATTASYYIIFDDGSLYDEDIIEKAGFSIYDFYSDFNNTSRLNISKINKALKKSWE